MTDLFWPGDERAGDLFSDTVFLAAMVSVESAWLAALGPDVDLSDLAGPDDLAALCADAEAGGNPVIPLVALLRERLEPRSGDGARLLHRGLTSQDVVDSALMLAARDAVQVLTRLLTEQVRTLAAFATAHRDTTMVARTLTQHAVPTTFGLKAATWLGGVLDAADDLATLTFPVQLGGAAGTMAAATELGVDVTAARTDAARRLGLTRVPPWHTTRAAVTRIGDALVGCTDACGRIANDVLTLSRPEIGELAEGTAGGSSTMPHKANPVLSVQVRRAALTTPQLAATLHLAAAGQVDERADGAWHAEWATLRDLVRRAVIAASQTADLLAGLQVFPERMAATLESARDDVLAEQRTMAGLAGRAPTDDYLGEAGALVDAVLDRAHSQLEEN